MKKRHTRLNTTKDCRRYLARCINDTNNGDMSSDLLRVLTYSLKALVGIMRDNELENRIENLEKPQELKINYPVYSESDERLIIKHLRSIERQALNPSSGKGTEREIVETIPEVSEQ